MDGTFAREEERKIMDKLLASEPAADLDGTNCTGWREMCSP